MEKYRRSRTTLKITGGGGVGRREGKMAKKNSKGKLGLCMCVCDRNEKRIAKNGKVRAHCLSVSKVVKNALHDKSF